ncbi:hypothetical protein [Methylobacter sp. S3L5C]|nr:hypothetical protein [Methylobacter sp. S3L5C]
MSEPKYTIIQFIVTLLGNVGLPEKQNKFIIWRSIQAKSGA